MSLLLLSLASLSFFCLFVFASRAALEENLKVHPLQNPGSTIGRFIQMPVILWVLSQQDPVAPQIGRKSTINFSVPWWLSVCAIASFFWQYFIGWIKNLFWMKAQIRFVSFSLFRLYFWFFSPFGVETFFFFLSSVLWRLVEQWETEVLVVPDRRKVKYTTMRRYSRGQALSPTTDF